MQDKLHVTIKQLEDEKSLWLQKGVGITGNCFCLYFFLKLLFGTIIFDKFGENHSKCIHHFTSTSTFHITTASIQSACFHKKKMKKII
jgi:hypothetical protein